MSTKTISKLKINKYVISAALEVDKALLSSGEILTVKASFSQNGKDPGYFITSECVIATPVNGPLEILDTAETYIQSEVDPQLSVKCEKANKYFLVLMHDAIVQASGVFISHDKRQHHIITDPLLIKMRKTKMR